MLALSRVQGIGPVISRSLISFFGSAEQVFRESPERLALIPGIAATNARAIRNFRDWAAIEKEIHFVDKNGIRALPFTHSDYPQRLNQIPDGPIVLFAKGGTNLNHTRFVSIVGTRRNTQHGAAICERIVQELKDLNVYVVSGLAIGIDICAHRACNANDIPNLGVVAHGLDQIYPYGHRKDATEMIAKGGGIISDFFSGTKMVPDLFPRRNRLVAGLCDALLVVESQGRGGSMITAGLASGYNRDVFAVPGRVTDPMSAGCHLLVRNLKAGLCTSAVDLAYGMNWEFPDRKTKEAAQGSLFVELNEEEKRVAGILRKGELAYDSLLQRCKLPVNKLTYTLFELEMKNVVRVLPGKVYELIN